MTGKDLTSPHVTGSNPEVTSYSGSYLEVAVEGLKAIFWVRLSSYRAELAGGGNHVRGNDLVGLHVTGRDPEVTSFARKSPESACRSPKAKFWVRLSLFRAVTRSWWQSRDRK